MPIKLQRAARLRSTQTGKDAGTLGILGINHNLHLQSNITQDLSIILDSGRFATGRAGGLDQPQRQVAQAIGRDKWGELLTNLINGNFSLDWSSPL